LTTAALARPDIAMQGAVIGLPDIERAARTIRGRAVKTPLLQSLELDALAGGAVLIKPECLQRIGAFKFRGAYNRLSRLSAAERRAGVVAWSSGNHAQGVALAAQILGIGALIVLPADAPAMKLERTRALGAEIRLYDRAREDREAIARAIAAERGAVIVPSYDDPLIIAGQGTIGLEIARQATAANHHLDLVVGPIGGGGLMAGVATAVAALSPSTQLVGVEPEGFDDTRLSLAASERRTAPPHRRGLCDALESPMPGALTFPILKARLAVVLTVNDREVADAMRYAFTTLKLVVEPGGVVALAAILAGKIAVEGRTAAIILSGGNVDPALFAKVIQGEI
jgi:threonine dehydratase